jgi:hypothetical protein
MIFTKIPNNLASYQEPLVYEFECGAEEEALDSVEVKILLPDGSLLARKMLHSIESVMAIDIAPYLRQALPPTMVAMPESEGVVDAPYNIDVVVEVLGQRSEGRRFVAAKGADNGPLVVLNEQIKHRTMTYDEFDTIGVLKTDNILVEVVIDAFDKSSPIGYLNYEVEGVGQKVVYVRPAEFDSTLRSMVVTILCDGEPIESIEYEVRKNLSTAERIGWLNEHLAPEFYTFPLRKSLLIEATRRRMASIWGKEAAAVEQRNELKLISAYEPEAQIKALSRILSSEKVWLQRGAEAEAEELSTQRVLIAPSHGVGFLELDLQAAKRGVWLW